MHTLEDLTAKLEKAQAEKATLRGQRDKLDCRLAEIGNLIEALQFLCEELGSCSIEPKSALSSLRGAIVGVSGALAQQLRETDYRP